MMRESLDAFDQRTRDFSMGRALSILERLRGEEQPQALRRAS
jgi:hypothetical protein